MPDSPAPMINTSTCEGASAEGRGITGLLAVQEGIQPNPARRAKAPGNGSSRAWIQAVIPHAPPGEMRARIGAAVSLASLQRPHSSQSRAPLPGQEPHASR
ncbi:hypothetical protein ASNO1_20110 [Corallococcus caeni]|uniref:Uncharacterized protein n=1 Tax=Corallococcus caeni TaxID=3082388 RepID=A0ABQ6QR31_9BACT|nr:hypothetical protein ASNO1_20110 [Corallococcus sp. NO1]